jgi:hypothetical protein
MLPLQGLQGHSSEFWHRRLLPCHPSGSAKGGVHQGHIGIVDPQGGRIRGTSQPLEPSWGTAYDAYGGRV